MKTIDNIMKLATDLAYCTDDEFGEIKVALRAAIEQALTPGEPVAEFRGRRQTPEGTTEFWGFMLCDPMQDPPKGAKLYLGPVNDPVPADWRSVIPGGRYTDKWESARVGDFNEGWNTYRKAVITALSAAAPHPQPKPLFGDLIAQHPGLSEELAEMQAPNQEPVACKTLCDLCVKRGYESCANVAKITAIPAAPQLQREWVGLSGEEVTQQCRTVGVGSYQTLAAAFKAGVEFANAKLKEKNGGGV